jgi:hypothetical protein
MAGAVAEKHPIDQRPMAAFCEDEVQMTVPVHVPGADVRGRR